MAKGKSGGKARKAPRKTTAKTTARKTTAGKKTTGKKTTAGKTVPSGAAAPAVPKPKRRYTQNTLWRRAVKKAMKDAVADIRCIPRAPFIRLLKEIMDNESRPGEHLRIQAEAVYALQTAAEGYLTTVLTASALLASHAKRVTIMPKDFYMLYEILKLFPSDATNLLGRQGKGAHTAVGNI
ncbi:centromeric DNA-binding histone H3-like protein cse4 [Fusarium poae]|uniref:hypothetical protein n=1 Tax=Fusarium poae TaxID=36050 RepID=UPI001CE844E1|nr:hypothetical protein FPOAC1_004001 [Fusarium poae]KAG8670767.1 hypothetical protein FPOAC1_004001 [Fusarium poae]